MITLFVETTYSLITLAGAVITSFGAGLLFKMAVIRKQRKRILSLEDEMLANHSRILELEKKIAETPQDKTAAKRDFDLTSIKANREAKAS